jgi:hypothetical protein
MEITCFQRWAELLNFVFDKDPFSELDEEKGISSRKALAIG